MPSEREILLARWHASGNVLPVRRRLNEAPDGVVPPSRALRWLADDELDRPGRYRLGAPPAPGNPSWWQRMWQWIGDRWRALWDAVFGRIHLGRAVFSSIGDATIVAIALLLVLAVFRIAALRMKPMSRALSTQSRLLSLSPEELAERANVLARDGAYASAARLLFSAMLAALDARGVLRDDRSSTVGELRRFLRGREPALVDAFNDVAAAFVAGAYAERAVERREWDRALESYRAMVEETAA
ncbi:MAG: DUF4129 domain-containing protein [Candidatus Eremiobacteraeota bacterium]|nr:DUF4129 domain-containing protein [Candidatus Eremiobacteraeota bacterium]